MVKDIIDDLSYRHGLTVPEISANSFVGVENISLGSFLMPVYNYRDFSVGLHIGVGKRGEKVVMGGYKITKSYCPEKITLIYKNVHSSTGEDFKIEITNTWIDTLGLLRDHLMVKGIYRLKI